MSYTFDTKSGGVYGTNGIVLRDVEGYPAQQKYFNVGWHTSNAETFEVDFVGHSWFFKREYLDWMLAKPYKNHYKYVSEDMSLSYACIEHGVKTYVPLHPKEIISLWGSIPKYGWKYGTDKSAALSLNSNNSATMMNALHKMHNDGWKILLEREPEYFAELEKIFIPPPSPDELLMNNIKAVFTIMGKKPPVFLGDKNYTAAVKKLFDIVDADYNNVLSENNVLNARPYAFNIFFTELYPQLKKLLETAGLKEYENFIDGRIFLKLV